MKRTLTALFTLIALPTSVNATDLDDIYQLAIKNDPQFLAAYSTYQAELTAKPQHVLYYYLAPRSVLKYQRIHPIVA